MVAFLLKNIDLEIMVRRRSQAFGFPLTVLRSAMAEFYQIEKFGVNTSENREKRLENRYRHI
jgi:hypothetical protein